MKPQAAAEALAPYAPLANGAVVISVMAGTSIAALAAILIPHSEKLEDIGGHLVN